MANMNKIQLRAMLSFLLLYIQIMLYIKKSVIEENLSAFV